MRDLLVDDTGLKGRLTSLEAIRRFVEAGNATLTVRSLRTRERFTFKFVRPENQPQRASPIWVRLLTGSDNQSHYEFLGTIWMEMDWSYHYVHSKKSRIKPDAPGAIAALWLSRCIGYNSGQLLEKAEVWHEGSCGRCGRKLTVPESVVTGFGPECARIMGLN